MNAQLFQALENKWLANAVSFAMILTLFLCAFALFPTPLPTGAGSSMMPWWAPLGGFVFAVQVYAGLPWVHKVGCGLVRVPDGDGGSVPWLHRARGNTIKTVTTCVADGNRGRKAEDGHDWPFRRERECMSK